MIRKDLNSSYKSELIDISEDVAHEVMKLGVRDGICTVFTPHTTAAVVLFEKTNPKLKRDFLTALSRIAPADMSYESGDDNTPAHIKATLCGPRIVVPVKDGQLQLGEWQAICFCEFDGPREREYIVQVV